MIGPSLPHVKGSILILAVIEVTLRVNYINVTDRVYGTAIKEYNIMRSFASRYQAGPSRLGDFERRKRIRRGHVRRH